jgi:uncharacterized protein
MNPASERLLVFFTYDHLPAHLQATSQPLCDLAWHLARTLDSEDPAVGAEVTTGLRKLLEAKDCFVRARLQRGHPNEG